MVFLTFAVLLYYSVRSILHMRSTVARYSMNLTGELYNESIKTLHRNTLRDLRHHAAELAEIIELRLHTITTQVAAAAVRFPRIRNHNAVSLLLKDLVRETPPGATAFLIDLKNKKIKTSPQTQLPFEWVRKTPWIHTVLEEAATRNKPFITEPHTALNGTLTVSFVQPIPDPEKNISHLIGIFIPMDSLLYRKKTLHRGNNIPLLIDPYGNIAAGKIYLEASGNSHWMKILPEILKDRSATSLRQKIDKQKNGSFLWNLPLEEKETLAIAFARTGPDYFLLLLQPEKELIQILKQQENIIARNHNITKGEIHLYVNNVITIYCLICFIFLILILLTGYFLAHRLTRPITKLIETAGQIGNGHLDTKIRIDSKDELEDLAEAINKMADDLKGYIHNLNLAAQEKQRTEAELKAAAEIQLSMLPGKFPPFPERKELDIHACMIPAKEIGGDLYDFFFIDNDHLFFVIGDVSGKGIPAALFMATAKTLMRSLAANHHSPAEILLHTNNFLAAENDTCMFITVFCGILDCRTGEVVCCNAGHNLPFRKNTSSATMEKFASGFPLGPFPQEGKGFCKEERITLTENELLILYTDGFTEAQNENGELFGIERLQKIIHESTPGENLQTFTETLLQEVRKYSGSAPQSDDQTMLIIRYNSAYRKDIP
ncbi:MAG: SpoIIE family protein phosphatase [Lentisphaeria bacterium]|nr:SpoIIE family protein phosphatase [Lentisphaeria bacterium]